MADTDIRTTLRIDAAVAGVEEAVKAGERIQEALEPAKAVEGFERLEAQIEAIGRGLVWMGAQGANALTLLEQGFDRLANKAARAAQESERARGSFAQGLAQGSGMGEYIPRGPGMGQQIAGRMTGQIGRGVLSTPFSGMAGLSTALSAIPGGGVIAGAMQQGVSFAESALAYEGMELSALPLLDIGAGYGAGPGTISAEAASRIAKLTAERDRLQGLSGPGAVPGVTGGPTIPMVGTSGVTMGMASSGAAPGIAAGKIGNVQAELDRAQAQAEASARSAAFRAAVMGPIEQMRSAGLGMGFSESASLAFGGGAAETAGSFGVLQRQGLLGSGLAANRLFGTGAGTIGSFAAGGRLGAFTGGGTGDSQLEAAIGRGLQMGLERTELRERLERIATGVEEFRRTGIRIDPEGTDRMAGMFRSVLGAGRGGMVAEGVRSASTRVSSQGPQDFLELMMLQEVGFSGGGLGEYQRARSNLEGGAFGEKQLQSLYGRLTAGRDPETAAFNIEQVQKRLFGQSSVTESRLVAADQLDNVDFLTDAERDLLRSRRADALFGGGGQREIGAAISGTGGLVGAATSASGRVAPGTVRGVGIEAEQRAAGKAMMGVMQDFAQSTTSSARALSRFGPQIEKVTDMAADLAKALDDAAASAKGKKKGS